MSGNNCARYQDECYACINKRNVPGNTHIECVKPDLDMTGNAHGIASGWFYYPLLFDPIWRTKECCNFQRKGNNHV